MNLESKNQKLTPMMRQYLEIKHHHQDAILFFRLGDFYEMFFEDAVKASEVLDIALTSRNKNQESSVPLCGIPYHSASQYIRKLIEEGLKVAICEQVEDPKEAKGIVKREVIRVISPGLLVEDEVLASGEANYLGALKKEGEGYHLSMVDISTGEIQLGFFETENLASQEILKHHVKELLVLDSETKGLAEGVKRHLPRLLLTERLEEKFQTNLDEKLYSPALLRSLEEMDSPKGKSLVLSLLNHVQDTQRTQLKHLGPIQILRQRQFMSIDERTFRHLELTKNQRGEGRNATLYQILNKTRTAMGARRLAKWIHYPLMELKSIHHRLDAVGELVEEPERLQDLVAGLQKIQDLERMLGKLALGTVNGRDLRNLGSSLQEAQALKDQVGPKFKSEYLKNLVAGYPQIMELAETLLSQLVEEPPLTVREGGVIASGVHSELDELRSVSRDGKSFIAGMEQQERDRSKIPSLKIRFNKVFGYYIEVTNTHRDRVPDNYIRKQTLANAERFITPELKEYENKVLGAEERIKQLEYEIFCELRERCSQYLESLREAADILGTLDVLGSLARVARENRYCRPELCEEPLLELEDSRHPVLERLSTTDRFIPNDIQMDGEEKRLFLITGPNMAGKSTVMRQAALSIIMAQMGGFVPAKRAKVGLVDQLFARIGASDDLAQGQSTFMVEMLETAHILKSASAHSFILLDEIGRGTSTYDGMSIAWAVAEYVGKKILCRALFATHYHELVDLAAQVPGVVNFQVAVKEWNDEILFLRKLIPGGASRSYGIEVARLAG
ncbi:MAG: DNA mismatch repair protein MutS, partial [bacterium]|nr:DNA mismatch repair protein MutS [bacterium]